MPPGESEEEKLLDCVKLSHFIERYLLRDNDKNS